MVQRELLTYWPTYVYGIMSGDREWKRCASQLFYMLQYLRNCPNVYEINSMSRYLWNYFMFHKYLWNYLDIPIFMELI